MANSKKSTKLYSDLMGLSIDLGKLYSDGELCDVTLSVAGTEIHAHKLILAARSSYFRSVNLI